MTVFDCVDTQGTGFFGPVCAPSGCAAGFGVFMDLGGGDVRAEGQSVVLGTGDGVDLTSDGIEAAGVKRGSQKRVEEAFASDGSENAACTQQVNLHPTGKDVAFCGCPQGALIR